MVVKITPGNFVEQMALIKKQLDLKKHDFNLLLDSYRRYILNGFNNPTWNGLGMPSQFKHSDLYVCASEEISRAHNWYVFTTKGKEIFEKFLSLFSVDKVHSNDLLICCYNGI